MQKEVVCYTNRNGKLCAIVKDKDGNMTVEETQHEAVES